MEELKVSPSELKELVDNSKLVGEGSLGRLYEYQDRVIKLDRILANLLEINDKIFADEIVNDYYKYKSGFNREKIEDLVSRQNKITLTKLPTGIITLKDVNSKIMSISPGIIIPYHKNHLKLETLSKKDYKRILIILRRVLNAARELAANEIAQEDFIQYDSNGMVPIGYNIMYKNNTPQIIDLDDEVLTRVGKDFEGASEMYRDLGNIVLDYFKFNGLDIPVPRDSVSTDYEIERLLDIFEKETKHKKI